MASAWTRCAIATTVLVVAIARCQVKTLETNLLLVNNLIKLLRTLKSFGQILETLFCIKVRREIRN